MICVKKFFILLFAFLLVFPVFAHAGKTDHQGGHTNKSTGEYHYHHGYPAHQHKNGICLYDFDDKTVPQKGLVSDQNNFDAKKALEYVSGAGVPNTNTDSPKNSFSFKEHPILGTIAIILSILYLLYFGFFLLTPFVLYLWYFIKFIGRKAKYAFAKLIQRERIP